MSESPASYQEHLRFLKETKDTRQGGPAGPGPSQNPNIGQSQALEHSQDQPIDVEQEDSLSQQQRRSAQQKAALAQAAAKMAEDAASMAGKAAEMARQAAEMAARAADLPWDGPSTPVVWPFFNMAPGYGSSNRTLIPPQPPQPLQQIDQPMENYQSQFPVTEGSKRKRKSRASGQEAGGRSSSQPAAAIAPNPVVRPNLMTPEDSMGYQNQLMLLEQQNKKRLARAERQQQSGESSGSRAVAPIALNPVFRPENLTPNGLSYYQYQLILIEQHKKEVEQEKARQQRQGGEGSASGGA